MINGTLVLEGGATRGVFTSGALDYLMEKDQYFSHVIGVSAGSCNAVDYVSKQPGRTRDCMIHKDKEYSYYYGFREFIKEKSILDMDMVFDKYPKEIFPFDYETYFASDMTCEIVTVNCETGKAEYMEVPRGKEMKDLLIATCSLPILFQPVKIGRHYYLDGGLADSVPYEHAMEMGCEKLVVVLTRERGYVKTQEKAAGVMNRLYQRYPKIVEDMKLRAERYNASMEKLMQLEKEEKVFVIAPESTYGVGRTETDTIKLRRLYDEGYRIATEQTDALRAYLNK